QYDPECITCHVVGYGLKSGYDGGVNTRHLREVGCENCHGAGSMHVNASKAPQFQRAMSPWKANPGDLLPVPVTLAKGFEAMNPQEQVIFNKVNDACTKCHDPENDPHFKFAKNWPQIIHGKNAKAPIPPAAAAQKP